MSVEETQPPEVQARPGQRPGVVIVEVKGPLTIRNFLDFQDAIRRDAPVTIVDLGGVPFLDSAALGCLVGLHASCERSGRKYALVQVPEGLHSMFSMTGVGDFLVIYPTAGDAESALAA